MTYNPPTIDVDETLPRLQRHLARQPDNLETVRDKLIIETLALCKGNVSETARRMGAHRRTVQRRITTLMGEERTRYHSLTCSEGALNFIETQRKKRELPSRGAALDEILAEWKAARRQ